MLAAESFTAAVAPARCHVGRGVRPTAVAASSSKRMTSVPTKVRGRRVVRARAVETASTTEQEVDQDDEGNAVPLETVSDKGSNPESFPKTPSSANENTFVRSIARQGRGDTNGVTLNDLLATHTGGPPRFFSPIRDDFRSVKGHASKGSVKEYVSDDYVKAIVSKPTLLYVPGLDGTGFAASSQFASLHEDFNVSCLNVPVNDRADFSTLVQVVVQYLEGIKNPEGEGKNPEGAAGFEPRTRRTGTDATGGNRVVYLLGESMGGLVALGVAQQRPDLVDKLVLVNPGSSFDRSVWPLLGPWLPSLPEDVYKAVPYVLAPVLFDPPKLLEGALKAAAAGAVGALNSTTNATTDPLQTPAGVAAALAELANLFPALGQLSSIIPRNTLAHRLKILEEGCASVNAVGALERFGDMEDMESSKKSSPTKRQTIKTLVLVSTNDNLIPSADEGTRLMKRMPPGSCVVQTLQGASHAALQEAGVDLTAVMRENGFAPRRPSDTPSMSNDPKFTPPCAKDLRAAFEGLDTLRSVVSPVFFSTREDGTVIPGLGAVPFDGNGTHRRPVLLVGNHQTVAPDLPFILERFIVDRNVLPRGLAHPVVMGGGRARGRSGADDILEKKKGEDQRKKDGTEAVKLPDFFGVPPPPGLQSLVTTAQRAVEATLRDGAGAGARGQPLTEAARQFGGGDGPTGISQFSKFGAVPVSGRNLYKLLNNGECILLFPGGVREAFKRKNERYQLFWPTKPEFIRMAARHDAVIVPFSAVGVEDGFEVVFDADDIGQLPFGIGDGVLENARKIPSARKVDTRVTIDGAAEEAFVPLLVPKMQQRYYFKFGKPIYTESLGLGKGSSGKGKKGSSGTKKESSNVEQDEADSENTEKEVLAMYHACRESVEDGIDWLLRKRVEDPFGDTPGRILWEQAAGKQAPTFIP